MDNRLPKPDPPTRTIPRLDTGRAGPVALIGADLARFQDIAASAAAYYGWTAFRIRDRLSRRRLEKPDNPSSEQRPVGEDGRSRWSPAP